MPQSGGRPLTVMFSAGEASGDRHAAALFQELRKYAPQARGIGMGGAEMRRAGVELSFDSSGIGVIGLFEIIKHYPEIRKALNLQKDLLRREKPDLLICVDYKEFNLKLARHAKSLGVKVLFYVGPQVWAWRPGRVKTYGKAVDMMAVIFPFEPPYYEAHGVPVRYVGHPALDKVSPARGKAENLIHFGLNPAQPIVGIFPGSRGQEIKRMLPVMLQAAQRFAARHPGAQFILPQAGSVADAFLHPHLAACPLQIKVVKQQMIDVALCCDAIMTTSGTATLEIALIGAPMAICYRLSALSYWLGKQLVNIPYIGLPNIIAGKPVVKEFIQHALTAENLAAEMEALVFEPARRAECIAELAQVKQRLGSGGGSKNMAQLALEMLN